MFISTWCSNTRLCVSAHNMKWIYKTTVACSNDACTDHFPVHVQTVRHASSHAGAIDLSPSVATDHSTSTPAFSTSNQTIVTLTLRKQQHCNAIWVILYISFSSLTNQLLLLISPSLCYVTHDGTSMQNANRGWFKGAPCPMFKHHYSINSDTLVQLL